MCIAVDLPARLHSVTPRDFRPHADGNERMRNLTAVIIVAACVLLHASGVRASPATDEVLANVKMPPGFKLELFADDVPGARSLAIGANGTIFVGTRRDRVYAVSPPSGPEDKPIVRVIARGLNMPNG